MTAWTRRRAPLIWLAICALGAIFLWSSELSVETLSALATFNTSDTPCLDAIHHQRRILLEAFGESLAGVTHVAVVDFPAHHNAGDAAIWLGEAALLEALGIETVYICATGSYDAAELDTALDAFDAAHTAVLFHGGGNFGDIYPVHQVFRNLVLADMPHRRIRSFPQTFEFRLENPTQLLTDSLVAYAAHPDVELAARDSESFSRMAAYFPTTQVRLLPDVAFMIGHDPHSRFTPPTMRPPGSSMRVLNVGGGYRADFPREPSAYAGEPQRVRSPLGWPVFSFRHAPDHDVFVVARTDGEGSQHRHSLDHWSRLLQPYDTAVHDWKDEWKTVRMMKHASHGTIDDGRGGQTAFRDFWDHQALLRVQWAMDAMSNGKIDISDRLHASIMATLLGISHVVVESGSLRKVETVTETWLQGCILQPGELEAAAAGEPRRTDANTVFVHTDDEAAAAARAFLAAERHGSRWARVSE